MSATRTLRMGKDSQASPAAAAYEPGIAGVEQPVAADASSREQEIERELRYSPNRG
jgi:hypothetical protein